MKYQSPEELIAAHIKDFVDSYDNAAVAAKLAHATLMSVLMTAHEGDTEKVIDSLDELHRYAMRGIDSGELRYEVYQ